MGKIVKLSDSSQKAEDTYLAFMTKFWEEHDLYWKLSNGGFFLWSVYVDAGNTVLQSDMKTLAAAANLLIIEYNKDRILEEGHSAFIDPIEILSSYYQIKPGDITKMSVKLQTSLLKLRLDTTEMGWDDEADDRDDDMDENELTEAMLKSKEEIMAKKCNLHVIIDFETNLPFTKEQFTKAINTLILDVSNDESTKLYQINFNETDLSFSIDCLLGFMVHFVEMMEDQYQVTPEFVVVREIDENAFKPELFYTSFMETYRDLLISDLENEADLSKYIENFKSQSASERRKQNPKAREDDEYGAILLYDLPQAEGIENARNLLKTNQHNIEAQLLIAGWEGDLEKRIDLLTGICDINNLDYDYKQIQKDKMWWGASHTRPFMRAKYLLAKTYEIGGYIDDAIDGYKEIIDMNPTDNLGARLDLMRLLYKLEDKKEMASLVNKFPNEVDEYFSFAGVYLTFMKYGKSSKTEKKIIFSFNSNYYLACEIAKIDADQMTELFDISMEDDSLLFENFESFSDDIIPLFKNAELLKYYRKVVKEIVDRLED
jgi:hypothetical protein